MADDKTKETENSLGMSDEDYLNMDPAAFEVVDDVSGDDENDSDDDSSNEENLDDSENSDNTEDNEDTPDDDQDDDSSENDIDDDGDTQSDDDDTEDDDSDDTEDSDDNKSDTDGDTQETDDDDHESDLERILKPFKANGKDMQVDSVDDAITLMQMGANYNKKMMALQPNLKIIKMLQNNDLLDQDKLNVLIDLSKKNPAAITKLVKDSGLNPLDIDTGDESDYSPTNYAVTDQEFNLDQAIDDIKGNESYDKTISVIGKQWDDKSKNIIVENPEIVGIIDSHVQNGVYETVSAEVEKQRALGRLNGIPDLVAYRQTVELLQKNGTLVDGGNPSPDARDSEAGDKPNKLNNAISKEAKKKKDAKLKRKRKAAASTKKTTGTKKSQEALLEMSDEDFMKKYS